MKMFYILAFFSGLVLSASGSLPAWQIKDTFNDASWTNNWTVTDGTILADLTTNLLVVTEGSALEIKSGSVSQVIGRPDKIFWISFQARIEQFPENSPAISNNNTSVAFYVNTNGNLVVYNGQTQEEPTELQPMPLNQWVRFDIYCDYHRNVWRLGVVGSATNLTDWLDFYTAGSQVESLLIANGDTNSIYIDDFSVQNTEPSGNVIADAKPNDENGIPFWWGKHFFNNPDVERDGIAANGMKRWQAYIAGLDPTDPDDVLRVSKAGLNGRRLGWNGKPGRVYDVYYAESLTSGFDTHVATFTGADYIEFQEAENEPRLENPSGFYKILVSKP